MAFGSNKKKRSKAIAYYQIGLIEYKDGNHKKALRFFKKSAEAGWYEGLLRMGEEYEKGGLVARNLNIAREYYGKAIDTGKCKTAYVKLYKLFLNPEYEYHSEKTAEDIIRKGAEAEEESGSYNSGASFELALLYCKQGKITLAEELFERIFKDENSSSYQPPLEEIKNQLEDEKIPISFYPWYYMAKKGDGKKLTELVEEMLKKAWFSKFDSYDIGLLEAGRDIPLFHYHMFKYNFLFTRTNHLNDFYSMDKSNHLMRAIYHYLGAERLYWGSFQSSIQEYESFYQEVFTEYLTGGIDGLREILRIDPTPFDGTPYKVTLDTTMCSKCGLCEVFNFIKKDSDGNYYVDETELTDINKIFAMKASGICFEGCMKYESL